MMPRFVVFVCVGCILILSDLIILRAKKQQVAAFVSVCVYMHHTITSQLYKEIILSVLIWDSYYLLCLDPSIQISKIYK